MNPYFHVALSNQADILVTDADFSWVFVWLAGLTGFLMFFLVSYIPLRLMNLGLNGCMTDKGYWQQALLESP